MWWIYWILLILLLIVGTVLIVGFGSCVVIWQLLRRLLRVDKVKTRKTDHESIRPVEEEAEKLLSNEEKLDKFRAEKQGNRVSYLWLNKDNGDEEKRLTFQQLYRICCGFGINELLKKNKLGKGERAIIILPPGLQYNVAFLSCLLSGIVPIPVYPPTSFKRDINNLIKIANNSRAKYIISTNAIHYKIQMVSLIVGNFKPTNFNWIHLPEINQLLKSYTMSEESEEELEVRISEEDVAYVQYTSGTTDDPKGCVITHEKLLHALHVQFSKFEPPEIDHYSILASHPPYHDFGLFVGICASVYTGCTTITFSPQAFLERPVIYLKALHSYKPLFSVTMPVFIESLLTKTTVEERKLYPIPKHCTFIIGGQYIDPMTMSKFSNGFNVRNIVCGYGLSECILGISTSPLEVVHVDTREMCVNGKIKLVPVNSLAEKVDVVSCGKIMKSAQFALVDPVTLEEVDEYTLGELWIADKTVCDGYLNDEERTLRCFNQRYRTSEGEDSEAIFFRTGDMCFFHEGSLFVVGRCCDMIRIGDESNPPFLPTMVEKAANQSHNFIKRSLALAVKGFKGSEKNRLILVSEIYENHRKKYFQPVFEAITKCVREEFGIIPGYIVLVRENTLPRTSSYKISRTICKSLLLRKKLKMIERKDNSEMLGKILSRKDSFDSLDEMSEDEAMMNAEGGRGLANYVFKKLDTLREYDKKHTFVMNFISERVKKVIDVETIDVTQPLASYGLSSMMAIQLTNELSRTVGKKISATLLFNYPTVEKLAEFLETSFFGVKNRAANVINEVLGVQQPDEPIAVIGMACHLNGDSTDIYRYWDLLDNGRSGVIEVPKERWNIDEYYDPDPEAEGKMWTKRGGFLTDVDKFDPQFFGISNRESDSMDPQHRLILQTSWHAFENAGIIPEELFETRTGVYIASCGYDYFALLNQVKTMDQNFKVDYRYAGTGMSGSVLAGRVSYVYGFQGPALTVDTACSSSLVSVHLACQALRRRDCDHALAGGVNLTLDPEGYVAFTKTRMLSPDGNCKTFDDGANGYVRGEGCGLVLLKRLSDAQNAGDRILALIPGSHINQDGKSAGITAPNGLMQELVIKTALLKSNKVPNDIDYIEAHGTGTSLGDPIEVQSLMAVFGDQGRERPLICGSVKTNIGHCEGAAGIAGLIKIILALNNSKIPQHLNLKTLNHRIESLAKVPMFIPNQEGGYDWDYTPDRKRVAGVSSFGFSGTNSHLIVEEAPRVEVVEQEPEPSGDKVSDEHIFCISAKSDYSLEALLDKYEEFVEKHYEKINLKNLCYTQNTTRTHFKENRIAIHSQAFSKLRHNLITLKKNPLEKVNGVYRKKRRSVVPPKVVFFYTGQGSQYLNMGRDLYDHQPEFRSWMNQCDDILNEYLGESILEVIFGKDDVSKDKLNSTKYSQPALFSIEYSLTKLWKALGIEPDILLGHSLGEVVAACVAEVMSLEDGLYLITSRAKHMSETAKGSMAAIFAGEKVVTELIEDLGSDVSIAGLNGQTNTVVSGPIEDVEGLLHLVEKKGIKFRKIVVSHAFHSKMMDDILDSFEKDIRHIDYTPPTIPIVSNLYGEVIDDEKVQFKLDWRYWRKHIRNPVQFLKGIECLTELYGNDMLFLEVGPSPHLCSMTRRILDSPEYKNIPFIASMKPGKKMFYHAICEVYTSGLNFRWRRFYGLRSIEDEVKFVRIPFDLPVYQFQKKSYWLTKMGKKKMRVFADEHPLLGTRMSLPNQFVFQQVLEHDCLSDHKIHGIHIFPAAGYIEIALAAVTKVYEEKIGPQSCLVVRNIGFEEPVRFLDENVTVQCVAKPLQDGSFGFEIFTVKSPVVGDDESEWNWKLHGSGEISLIEDAVEEEEEEEEDDEEEEEEVEGEGEDEDEEKDKKKDCKLIRGLKRKMKKTGYDMDEFYSKIAERGYHYGDTFRCVKEMYVSPEKDQALGYLEMHDEIVDEYETFELHPSMLDASLHVMLSMFLEREITDLSLPVSFRELKFYRSQKSKLNKVYAHVFNVNELNADTTTLDFKLYSESGNLICEVEAFMGRRVSKKLFDKILGTESNIFFDVQLEQTKMDKIPKKNEDLMQDIKVDDKEREILIFSHPAVEIGEKLYHILESCGVNAILIEVGDSFEKVTSTRFKFNVSEKKDYMSIFKMFPKCGKICNLLPLGMKDVEAEDLMMSCGALMYLIQATLDQRIFPKLFTYTCQCYTGEKFHQSVVWGMGRTIRIENAEMESVRIDLENMDNPYLIAKEMFIDHHDGNKINFEDEVVYKDGNKRFAPRLIQSTSVISKDAVSSTPLSFDPAKAYLISGGFGGLGLAMAEYLASVGVKRIVPIGRSEPKPEVQEKVRKIAEKYPDVEIIGKRGDVCVYEDMEAIFEECAPIGGVLHCAGVWRDAFLMNQNWEDFLLVLRPKVQGTMNLHKLSSKSPHKETVDHFVLFASMAGVFGSPGQANYSAANGFLDYVALYRSNVLKLPAVSIDWGAWGEIGLAAKANMATSKFGMIDLTPSEGIESFDRIMRSQNVVQTGVFRMNWMKFFNSQQPPIPSFLLSMQKEIGWKPRTKSSSREYEKLAKKLISISDPKKRQKYLVGKIQSMVAQVLKAEPDSVDVKRPLMELGMDSMTAVELRNTLQDTVGMNFAATLLFDYPNIEKLGEFLLKKMVLDPAAISSTSSSAPAKKRSSGPRVMTHSLGSGVGAEPIAVIGLACNLPSRDLNSGDEDAFWEMISKGHGASKEIPADRFDYEEYFDAEGGYKKMYTRHGTFLNNPWAFDPKFFGITPIETETMDPQQRLLLEVSWHAMENANIDPTELVGTKTGVFIGNMFLDYKEIVGMYGRVNFSGTGNHLSVLAGRISYVYGFQGPVVTMDTACSSSLVSSHMACQSLRNGECDIALAGGVNLLLNPYAYISECAMRMLSPDGYCKTFDDGADGYLRGEGCGIVVLKRLSDAKRDGDRILALLRGSCVNHDGRSAGLTAPNRESQERVIQTALDLAGLAPKDIDVIEAHGTGTPLGDPIEIAAVGNAYGGPSRAGRPILVGSAKTNIGHTEGCAGIAGMIKLILQLKHEKVAEHLNLKTLNTMLPDLKALDVVITNKSGGVDWVRDPRRKRLGAISSFGFSGTNAHMIIEEGIEYPIPKVGEDEKVTQVLCLSAKSKRSLKELCFKYIDYISEHCGEKVNLRDVCFTTNTLRSKFSERVAVCGDSHEEITQALHEFAIQSSDGDNLKKSYFGRVGNAQRKIVLFFTGQGSQWSGMGLKYYHTQPVFKTWMDKCDEILKNYLENGESIWEIITDPKHEDRLNSTVYSQPAIFSIEYCVAKTWMSFGLQPDAFLGHSLGEVVAACISGVMSLEDGLRLITCRAKHMQSAERGSMTAIFSGEEAVTEMIKECGLEDNIFIAGLNGQTNTVVSGDTPSMEKLIDYLETSGKSKFRKLNVSHAFHSKMMEPILDKFGDDISGIRYKPPEIPIISNLHKGLVIDEDCEILMDTKYWKQHIRNPVQFLAGIETLVKSEGKNLVCLEVGPSPHLSSMTRRILSDPELYPNVSYVPSLKKDWKYPFYMAMSQLFANGVDEFDFRKYYDPKKYFTVYEPHLPYYQFDHDDYSCYPLRDQVYRKCISKVSWKELDLEKMLVPSSQGSMLIYSEPGGQFSGPIAEKIGEMGGSCVIVSMGLGFKKTGDFSFEVNPTNKEDFEKVFEDACWKRIPKPAYILDCFSLSLQQKVPQSPAEMERCIKINCLPSIFTIQICSKKNLVPQIMCVTQNVFNMKVIEGDLEYDDEGGEVAELNVSQSFVWGLGKCIQLENGQFKYKMVDISTTTSPEVVAQEMMSHSNNLENQVKYTNDGRRYCARFVELEQKKSQKYFKLDPDGTILITGGCSGLGFSFGKYYLQKKGVKNIVLVGRSGIRSESVKKEVERLNRFYGGKIVVMKGDISKPEDVERLLKEIHENLPPLTAILHCAGIFDNCLVANQTGERFHKLFLPKCYGTLYLHQTLERLGMKQPDHFLLFSTIASVFGAPGNSSYAASNQFLDQFAHYRRQMGLSCVSVNFGLWGDSGAATEREEGMDRNSSAMLLKYEGQGLLTQKTGMPLFEQGVSFYEDEPQFGVQIMHYNNLERYKFDGVRYPYLEDVNVRRIGEPDVMTAGGYDDPNESGKPSKKRGKGRMMDDGDEEEEEEEISDLMKLLKKWEKESKSEEEEVFEISEVIRKMVEKLLDFDIDDEKQKLDINKDLVDYGVDSITGLSLRNNLSKWVGITLPINMAFTNPNVAAISGFIHSQKPQVLQKMKEIEDGKKKKKKKKGGAGEAGASAELMNLRFFDGAKQLVLAFVSKVVSQVHENKEFGPFEYLPEIEANIIKTNIVRNAMNEEYGIDIPVEEFFKAPCIARLSNYALERLFPNNPKVLIEIPTQTTEGLPKELGYIFNSNWLQCTNPKPDAKMRLIMTPPAGMNTMFYHQLPQFFEDVDVEIIFLHLPGRTSRLPEKLFSNMMVMAKVCVKEIAHVLHEKPYSLYGHCMGGQINYELFCEIRRQGLPPPSHFFVFSSHAPHIANSLFPEVDWDDEKIVDFIKETNGGVLPKALENRTMNKLILHIMRADLQKVASQTMRVDDETGVIYHQYLKEEIPKLDVDVTGWGGGQDGFVKTEYMEAWQMLISGKLSLEVFPDGDHYAYVSAVGQLKDDGPRILKIVANAVAKVIESL